MTMSGLGNRTAILTLSRLASYGLQLISPIFLVRLLTVADFGRYREFLLYAAILQAFAQFSINDSLLYCVPANPQSPWRLARQTALLTLCSSVLVVLVLVALDSSSGGRLVNGYVVPLAAYTMFSVNLDFWEYFWLANGRAQPVFTPRAAWPCVSSWSSSPPASLTISTRSSGHWWRSRARDS
jgi:O-antigen/teichoic acid export membrane protein